MEKQSGRNLSTIGSYRLLKLVGFGPISRLYLVQRENGSLEPLALKLIETIPRIFQQEHRQLFFSQEVDRFMQLHHRSLLPLYDAGIHDGYPYLVYPYIRPGSLADYLALYQTPKLPLDEALVLVYQLGKALEEAHQAQLVHGNLKPSNIFLLAKGAETPNDVQIARSVAALADFNIDSLTRGMRTARLQSTVSAHYMAPEQFWGAVTEWSDQYSLACIAYELLTGKPVFSARDFHTLEKLHTHEPPLPPDRIVPELPRETAEALLKALSKRVGDRYVTMQDFLTALTTPPVLPDVIPTRPLLPGDAPPTRPLIPASGKLILPLTPGKSGQVPEPANANSITEGVQIISDKRSTRGKKQKQQAQDSRWHRFIEKLKTLCYYGLVFCSMLIMWGGECWSIIMLLFLALRKRKQLWDEMQESSVRIPVVRPQTSLPPWLATLTFAWQQGMLRNRRRWKKVFRSGLPRRRKPRRLIVLIVGSVLGTSLCLSGMFFMLTSAAYHSVPRMGVVRITTNNLTQMQATSPTTNLVPTVVHQQPATPTPTPTLKPTPTAQPTSRPLSYPCRVRYRLVTQWPGGFEVELTIQNSSSSSMNGWILQFTFPADQQITQGWNGQFSQHGARVSITSLSYNHWIPAGSTLTTSPGFNGRWRDSNAVPTTFILNGSLCQTM